MAATLSGAMAATKTRTLVSCISLVRIGLEDQIRNLRNGLSQTCVERSSRMLKSSGSKRSYEDKWVNGHTLAYDAHDPFNRRPTLALCVVPTVFTT